MLGLTADGRSYKIQTTVGAALLTVAGGVAVLPLFGAPPEILAAAAGPLIAGSINLGLGLMFRHAAKRGGPAVSMSPEAAALLRALVVRAQVWQTGWRPRNAPIHGPHAWPGYRAPVPPSSEAMKRLERAADAHNRVMGLLSDAMDERSARLRAAADAGMAEALHQAATATGDLAGTADGLTELADRIQTTSAAEREAAGLRSTLQATLEELRAEDEARNELRGY